MHSLWGAGQMMFTKIMIVVDEDADIHDSKKVAKYISENFNPANDIYFTQGPVDVLDHSCSVMAFGGKMGIDATKKHPEETDTAIQNLISNVPVDIDKLMIDFPEIKSVNNNLIRQGISLMIISIQKNRRNHIREISEKLFMRDDFSTLKIILFVEGSVNASEIADTVWRFTNNIDPKRDHVVIVDKNGTSHIAFDGTRKTKALDGFQRDWPNILVSEDETIKHIDEIWEKLNLGKFIPSPSLKYKKQMYGTGAVVSD
jgi:4-hydroxy-3-polyprenylbenzoate decarboxylase